jgi:TolB protein
MNEPHTALHSMLTDLAGDVEPVDLYQPVIRRSRRIARRRAGAAAGAALAVVAVAGGGLWKLAGVPPAPPNPTPLAPHSVPGLPGTLFYGDDERVVRLALTGGPQPVVQTVTEAGSQAVVSSDGTKVAVLTDTGDVVLSEGRSARTVLRGAATEGYGPAWSADGGTLFAARKGTGGQPQAGLVTVPGGAFRPVQVPVGATDVLLSGDGRSLVYADGSCRLTVAPAAGGVGRVVPVFGDEDRTVNPAARSICDIVGLSPDASRAAVRLRVGGTGDEDVNVATADSANAVVDTVTGTVLDPPEDGAVSGAEFGPEGSMLYRMEQDDAYTLVLQDADGRTVGRFPEPASVRDMSLIGYTR